MKKTIAAFTSTLGFLWNPADAGFSILGVGTAKCEPGGKLNRNGHVSLVGLLVAGAIAAGTSVYEFAHRSRRRRKVGQAVRGCSHD